jgi:PucR C-terminal helix-turn-helix domain
MSLGIYGSRVIRRRADFGEPSSAKWLRTSPNRRARLARMRALVRYVSNVDSHTENALKVIDYFDALVEHRATLEACVRAAAGLSQCVAGLRDDASSWSYRFNQRGIAIDGAPSPTISHVVRVAERNVGEVWLERSDDASPLDELVVERMALAAGILWRASTRPRRSTASLMELVLTASASDEERSQGLRLLGFAPERPLDLAAVASDDAGRLADGLSAAHDVLRQWGANGDHQVVCSAVLGNVGAVLTQPGFDVPDALNGASAARQRLLEVRVGTGHGLSVYELPEAWQQAQTATRFGGLLGFGNIVGYTQLGSLAALALVPQASMDTNPDVQAVTRLASTARGLETLATLQKRLASGSLREAATALHLHHSSVSHRLRQAEKTLELELDNPESRLRAELAVILWKLSTR